MIRRVQPSPSWANDGEMPASSKQSTRGCVTARVRCVERRGRRMHLASRAGSGSNGFCVNAVQPGFVRTTLQTSDGARSLRNTQGHLCDTARWASRGSCPRNRLAAVGGSLVCHRSGRFICGLLAARRQMPNVSTFTSACASKAGYRMEPRIGILLAGYTYLNGRIRPPVPAQTSTIVSLWEERTQSADPASDCMPV